MTREATKAARALIEEKELDINDIETANENGKVTVPDVEAHIEKLEAESEESQDEPDQDDETPEDESGDDQEPESEDDGDEDKGSEPDKGEPDSQEEHEANKSDDNEPESKSKRGKGNGNGNGKGKLICVFKIKGEEKLYMPGDVYKGKRAEYLLSRGSIKRK